jgi:hypothetical protein
MAIINKAKFWMTTEAGSKDARKRYVRYVLSPYCEEWNDARINQSGFWNVVHVKEEVHNLSEFTRLSCRFLRGIDGYTRVDAVMSREEKIFYEAGRRLIRDILENIDKTHM